MYRAGLTFVTSTNESVTRESRSNTGEMMIKSSQVVTMSVLKDVNSSMKSPEVIKSRLSRFLVASFVMLLTQIRETDATFGFLSNGLSQLVGGGGGGGGGGPVNGRLTAGPITPVGTGAATGGGRFGVTAGSFGGNNGASGQSANLIGGLPGLPPGMTMTQDGCLCPVPKAKTKYIAVEVPKIVFIPPKEQKTKIITIKEVVSEAPANKYSAMSNNYNMDNDDSTYSSEDDHDSGVSDISDSNMMRNRVYTRNKPSSNRGGKSKTQATRHRVKVTKPDDSEATYSDDDGYDEDDNNDEVSPAFVAKKGKKVSSSISGHISNIAPAVKSSTSSSASNDNDDDVTVTRDKNIATVIGKGSTSIKGSTSNGKDISGDDTDDIEFKASTTSSSVRGHRRKNRRNKKKNNRVKHFDENDEQQQEEESENIPVRKVKKKTKRHSIGSEKRKKKQLNDVIDENNNVSNLSIIHQHRQVPRVTVSIDDSGRRNNAQGMLNARRAGDLDKYNHLSRYTDSQSKFDSSSALKVAARRGEEKENEEENEDEDKEESDAQVETDDATSRMQQVNVRRTTAPFTL